MNFLKKVAIAIGSMLVLLVLISFLVPGKVHVERSVSIAAPPEQIYEYVGTPKRWPEWVAWKPTKWEFPGAATGVGAESKWEDDNGGGHMKFTKTDPQTGVVYDLAFGGGEPVPGWIKFSPDGKATKVVWGFDNEAGWNPLSRYFCFFCLDSLVGSDFEKGLASLKKKVEAESLPVETATGGQLEEKPAVRSEQPAEGATPAKQD